MPRGLVGRCGRGFAYVAVATVSLSAFAAAPWPTLSTTAPEPTKVSPLPVTVTFDQDVTGFTADDVEVTHAAIADFSGSGATYTFSLVPSSDGVVTVFIPAGACQNVLNEPNQASPPAYYTRLHAAPVPGGIDDGVFQSPEGIAIDGSGNLYVVEYGSSRVQKFSAAGAFLTAWGSPGSGDGQLADPGGIAVDGSGNVYVADQSNHRIQKFTASGGFLAKWGSQGSGDGQFEAPWGIAVDASGNVCVTDYGNTRIQKFTASGDFLAKWGSPGSDDGQLLIPSGVATDGSDTVYVADSGNHRIQEFSASGDFLRKWGSFGVGDGQLNSPSGVAVDASGDVYVADQSNHRIQRFDSSGAFRTKWGDSGTGAGQFSYPLFIAVNSSGTVYVSDTTGRVQQFTPRLQRTFDTTAPAVETIACLGAVRVAPGTVQFQVTFREAVTGVDASRFRLTAQGLTGAAILGVSGAGRDYTVTVTTGTGDGSLRLDLLDDNGIVDLAGNTLGGPEINDGDFTGGASFAVDDPAVFVRTTVTIASTAPEPTNVSPLPVTVTFNQPVTGFTADDVEVTRAAVVDFAGSGATYTFGLVPTSGGVVAAFIPAAVCQNVLDEPNEASLPAYYPQLLGASVPGGVGFQYPEGLAIDASDSVFVADYAANRIQKFSASGDFLAKWGSLGGGDGQLAKPRGVAVSTSGDIYVADYGNNRIQKFSAAGAFLTKWGSLGTGDGQFSSPWGIAVDASGDVYVADRDNHRIQKFSASGDFLAKWGGFGADDGQLNDPAGVAVDASGNVYVAEYGNHRIQKFSATGDFLTKWGSAGRGDGELQGAAGVAVDALGYVYVTNMYSNRIQKFSASGTFLTTWGSYGYGEGEFIYPGYVAVNSSGTVYVSDNAGRLQQFTPRLQRTFDTTAPAVETIACLGAVRVAPGTVQFQVTFGEAVTGVDASRFHLTTQGLTGAAILDVSGSGRDFTVAVTTGPGDGSLRLDLLDDNGIVDLAGNALGGPEAGDGNFATGDIVSVLHTVTARRYVLTDLGALGQTSAEAVALNVSGQVAAVGYSGSVANRSVLWKNGALVDIGAPGAASPAAWDLNNAGVVVGEMPVNGVTRPFRWTEPAALVPFTTDTDGTSVARGVNNLGWSVGVAPVVGGSRCVLWGPDAAPQFKDDLGLGTEGVGINDLGQVVGYFQENGNARAFLWDAVGGLKPLGTLFTSPNKAVFTGGSAAYRVNISGHVVGYSWSDDTHVPPRAFLWTEAGGMIDLGAFTTDGTSYGWGINDSDQAVGEADASSGMRHAFVWDRQRGKQDLNDLLDPATGTGWTLTRARSINANGWIAGQGRKDGQDRAILLKPIDCDVNRSGAANAVDIQTVVNAILGIPVAGYSCDVNHDGAVNAIDLQSVIVMVLGVWG